MDYTDMSVHYDLIMTSGYYDYDAIVDDLVQHDARAVLEIGSGTGLILEKLAQRRPDVDVTGVDLTQAMLDIAAGRLDGRPRVTLRRQNVVQLDLGRDYDLAFSYGGVWYFVPVEDCPDGHGYEMISHIRDEEENERGFERIAAHLPSGATLLLGVQAPHADYTREVTGGLAYSQRITPIDGGFRKDYRLSDEGRPVMHQTTDYRTYSFEDAAGLLDKCGFDHAGGATGSMFLTFTKR
jgi:SAM-dependent methyltransferase